MFPCFICGPRAPCSCKLSKYDPIPLLRDNDKLVTAGRFFVSNFLSQRNYSSADFWLNCIRRCMHNFDEYDTRFIFTSIFFFAISQELKKKILSSIFFSYGGTWQFPPDQSSNLEKSISEKYVRQMGTVSLQICKHVLYTSFFIIYFSAAMESDATR